MTAEEAARRLATALGAELVALAREGASPPGPVGLLVGGRLFLVGGLVRGAGGEDGRTLVAVRDARRRARVTFEEEEGS